jgi:prophage regulatory protein
MEKRILRLPDVMKVTGLKRSSLYSAIQRNEFPKQVSLCVRSVGWNSEEVDAWVEERITASRGQK